MIGPYAAGVCAEKGCRGADELLQVLQRVTMQRPISLHLEDDQFRHPYSQ